MSLSTKKKLNKFENSTGCSQLSQKFISRLPLFNCKHLYHFTMKFMIESKIISKLSLCNHKYRYNQSLSSTRKINIKPKIISKLPLFNREHPYNQS